MKGLYNKYIIKKANGTPVSPEARYIVLRIDSGKYVEACRKGVMAFAEAVKPQNPDLAIDLEIELLGYVENY